MTYKEIQDQLNLTDELIKEAMMKLCNPKSQVLLKQNAKVPKFEPNEGIKINKKFTNQAIKMSLKPIPGAKASAGDHKKRDEADLETQKERAFVVEAVIVRNMKASKTE